MNQLIQATATMPTLNPTSSLFYGSDRDALNLGGLAKGGTYLATRPTTATFGEAGPEIAQFIPLSKLGSSNAGASSSFGGGMGAGGTLQLMVDLSPDLEARIIDKSLDNVSAVIRTTRNQR
jgi:hypothetical protein